MMHAMQHVPSNVKRRGGGGRLAFHNFHAFLRSRSYVPQSMDLSDDDLHSLIVDLGTSMLGIILDTVAEAPAFHVGREVGTAVERSPRSHGEGIPTGLTHVEDPKGLGSQVDPTRYAALRAFLRDRKNEVERVKKARKRCGERSGSRPTGWAR